MSQDDADEPQSRADRLTDRRSRSRERVQSRSAEAQDDPGQSGQSEQDGQTGQSGQSGQTGQSEQAGQTEQTSQSGQDSDSGGDSTPSEWSQASDENVKRENKALYMYLDERLHESVLDIFEDVKYHYRKAYDIELQKNRHVYPLILEYGMESVREMADSPSEIRDALDANPFTPVVPVDGDSDESESEYAA